MFNNSNITTMKNMKSNFLILLMIAISCTSCGGDNSDTTSESETNYELHEAFSHFDSDNVSILLDGDEVIITSNGLANHLSPYWSNTTERSTADPLNPTQNLVTPAADVNHDLFVEPTITTYEDMAPGNIDDFNGSATLVLSADPQLASSSTATDLGACGIAVSGAMIYNDREGENVELEEAVVSLDFNGSHTGPQSYHYHLEPLSISEDDDELIGVIADGFFLYGRKCTDTGTYPTDLDESGGHVGTTKYSDEEEYHYHVQNETYLNAYYILFPGDYQGTPSSVVF